MTRNSSDAVDVVVLGAGAAGLSAALEADSRGARVLVVEAAEPRMHTPNVRMSGGWIITADDELKAAAYLGACSGGLVATDRTNDWARRALDLEAWLGQIGVGLDDDGVNRAPEHPELPGADTVRIRRAHTDLPVAIPGQKGVWPADGPAVGGEALYRGLMHAASSRGIPIEFSSRAQNLVTSSDGTVCGVRFAGSGRVIDAKCGVVVATGGYGGSPELIRNNLAVPDTRFYGNPLNDGAGVRLCVSVGASLARMNRFTGRGIASLDTAEGVRLGFMVDMLGGGYVICDQRGYRYTNEQPQAALFHDFYYAMQEYDPTAGGFIRSPSYYVFDQRRMDAGPLSYPERGVCGVGLYDWSSDNLAELARGWIGSGRTPSEAAAAVGAKPAPTFDASVADYNRGCAEGDDSFGRPAQSLTPLDSPPFYCLPLHVGGPHTSGGPERDAAGRVVSALSGDPIPGLFSAGELGQAIGVIYPAAGASLSEAMCSGRAAAEHATTG